MKTFTTTLAMGLALLGAAACDDSPTDIDVDGLPTSSSPLLGQSLSQVDRMGIPAVNTAFVASSADKDRFNQSAPAADESQFFTTLSETIMARYGLDAAAAQGLTDFVLPDVLPLGDLSGFPNGRGLADDVIDADLGLIFGVFGPAVPALQSDNVDGNDVPFQGAFPYLATPQSN